MNRVLRDDPSKSDMHNRQGITLKMIWQALCDWHMWPLYILGMTHMSKLANYRSPVRNLCYSFSATVPVGPPHTYLTLSLRSLGFNTVQSNLLSVPAYVIGAMGLLSTCYLSEMINSRVLSTVILQFWALPLLIVLYTFTKHTSQWVYFAVASLIVGFPGVLPIQVAWTSRNSNSVSMRTISACLYNIFVQAGVIVSVSEPYLRRSILSTADKLTVR